MDLKKVTKIIESGEIQDSKTITAIMTYTSKKKLQNIKN